VLDLAVANINLPRNQTFTVRYRVHNDAAPVSAAYSSVVNGDNVATAFQTYSSQTAYFADGFTDPTSTNNSETISLYNPFTSNTTMTYRLKFHFVNNAGAEVILPSAGEGTIAGGKRKEINVRSLSEVLAKIQSSTNFRHYSITVETSFMRGTTAVDGAVFAQLNRFDSGTGNTITTGPTWNTASPAFFITNTAFSH